MKTSTIVLIMLLLVCVGLLFFNQGRINTEIAQRVGYTKVCVDKVSYLVFPNGASVQYNENGSIKLCN